jgi:hypothetical protein
LCLLQLKEEEERIEESEAETRKKLKADREHTKKWEETRESRVIHQEHLMVKHFCAADLKAL